MNRWTRYLSGAADDHDAQQPLVTDQRQADRYPSASPTRASIYFLGKFNTYKLCPAVLRDRLPRRTELSTCRSSQTR